MIHRHCASHAPWRRRTVTFSLAAPAGPRMHSSSIAGSTLQRWRSSRIIWGGCLRSADLASPVDEDAGLLGDWDSLPPAPPRAAKRGRLTEEGAHASQLASPARAARRTCVLGVQPPLLQHVALTVFLGELAQLPTGPLCGLALVAAQIRSPIYKLGLLCCEFKHGPTSAIIAPRLPFRCYQPDNAHTRAARSLRFFFNSGAGASCPLSRPLGGLGKAA